MQTESLKRDACGLKMYYLTKGFDFESLCFNDIPFLLLILHFVEHNSFNILDMRWNKWFAEIKINMSNTMRVL